MSSKFWFLTKQSLKKKVHSKWFVIVNILLAISIIALINIQSIITFFGGDFNQSTEVFVIDLTEVSFPIFKESIQQLMNDEKDQSGEIIVKNTEKTEQEWEKSLESNQVLIVFLEDSVFYVKAKMISKEKIDNNTYQYLLQGLNATKMSVSLMKENMDAEVLSAISAPINCERVVLDEKKSVDENMELIMSTVFPTLILPFFMLIIFLVQMIGGEICEEKTTRSMEIIISNVSPKVHLLSKIVASNLFIIGQGILLVLYAIIGFFLGTKGQGFAVSSGVDSLLSTLMEAGFLDKLLHFIPSAFIIMILSFLAYSLVAGILASMTTNMEDFQQIQTPIMLILLLGYYLAIMAGMFEGSSFIKVLSYVPFLSCFISPSLYMTGQIGIIDIMISIVLLIGFIFFLLKYGLRIYKIGILNYSNEKIWSRFAKAIKSKDDSKTPF